MAPPGRASSSKSYGVEKAKAEAKKKGYRVTEKKQGDGRIRLVCRR